MNIKKFKPNYRIFLKHQVSKSTDEIYLDHDSDKYVERKETKRISRGLYFGFLLLIPVIFNFTDLSKLNIIIQLLLVVLIYYLYTLIVESIHWFYAKFDKVE